MEKKKKTVSFNSSIKINMITQIYDYTDNYQSDACHFKQRIREMDTKLTPILNNKLCIINKSRCEQL
jgi:hypothetical protein